MDLSLSDEQKQLQDAAERFVRDKYAFENRRKIAATEKGWLPEIYSLEIGIDKKLVSVDRKAPMAGAEHIHQRVDPSRRIDVFSEMRSFRVEAVAVRLLQDQLTRPVRGTIVQEEKPIDAEAAVMVEKVR